jgi:hypothetical protein
MLAHAIEASVLDRLGKFDAADSFTAAEVGNGARHLQDAMRGRTNQACDQHGSCTGPVPCAWSCRALSGNRPESAWATRLRSAPQWPHRHRSHQDVRADPEDEEVETVQGGG